MNVAETGNTEVELQINRFETCIAWLHKLVLVCRLEHERDAILRFKKLQIRNASTMREVRLHEKSQLIHYQKQHDFNYQEAQTNAAESEINRSTVKSILRRERSRILLK